MCLIRADFGVEHCHCRVILVSSISAADSLTLACLLCAAANTFYSRLVGHYSQCGNRASMYVSFHLALIH